MAATAYESSRQISDNFYVDGGDNEVSVKKHMNELYNQYISQTQAFWNEARTDQRVLAGDQSIYSELYSQMPAFRRKMFNFNRVRRIVNMISGHQRKHRKSTIVMPIEGADEETADQLTSVISWAYNRDNVYNTISNAFERGALTSGMSLLSVGLDRTQDFASGDLRIEEVAYNSVMLDHFFRKQDLSDCGFIWTRKWITKQEAKFLLPKREDEIDAMQIQRYGNKDQKFYFMPENYQFTIKNLLPYDEFWYASTRVQTVLYDTKTGETIEWVGEKENLSIFLATYPEVKARKITVPTVKLAICLNDKVMYNGNNPLGTDKYPFVPVIGYWDPDSIYFSWKMQGVVRGLRDAQFLYNRRKVIELDMLESQINSGLKVMEGSLVDNNDVLKNGQGQPIFIKATAPLGMGSVEKIEPPVIPATTIQLSEILSKEINEISGVSEELLGMADDDKSGILSMLRQGAGLITLEKLFDQLDMSQKILGERCIEVIQKNFTYGKIRRIIGKEPTPQFKDKAFQKYDCSVAEGLLTETQRKMEFIQYVNLAQMGVQVPPELLVEKAPITGKKDLKDAVQKKAEAEAKAQEQAQKLQLQAMAVDNQTKVSFSHAQDSLAKERLAKIQEERAVNIERIQRADEERMGALLNLVKALKELQGMNLDQIMKGVEILNEIEGEKNEGKSESARGINQTDV